MTLNECLHAGTRSSGSCIRYKLPSLPPPFGWRGGGFIANRCCLVVMVSMAKSTKATSLVLLVSDDANDTGRGCFGSSFLSKLEPSNQQQPARLMLCAEAIIVWSRRTCYMVDPASSHMLVSKIKPCMCKYELIRTVKLRMAH